MQWGPAQLCCGAACDVCIAPHLGSHCAISGHYWGLSVLFGLWPVALLLTHTDA